MPEPVVIPEEHQEKSWAKDGFADQGAVFTKIDELHTQANAPIVVPENYKEEAVFEKVKGEDGNVNQEKVFEQLVNLSKVAGKKSAPFNYTDATENEVEAHLASTRPENVDAYDWGEEANVSETDKKFIGDSLMKLGIGTYKGNKFIKEFTAERDKVNAEMFSEEGQKAIFKKDFEKEGDWAKIAGETSNFIKGNLSEEDQKLLEFVPNQFLGLIYRLQHNMVKAYGITEGTDRGGSGGGANAANVDAKRAELRGKIDALRGKPYSTEEITRLNNELTATYTANQDKRLQGGKK